MMAEESNAAAAARVVCDACGLPPEPPKKLVRCGRCKSAWYHDAACAGISISQEEVPQSYRCCHSDHIHNSNCNFKHSCGEYYYYYY